jgi:hypothetical protein
MALKLTKTTPHGFIAENAYLRIEEIKINQKRSDIAEGNIFSMRFILRHYRKNDGCPFFAESEHFCFYDISGQNPILQAYEYLKTQDEFSQSEDC